MNRRSFGLTAASLLFGFPAIARSKPGPMSIDCHAHIFLRSSAMVPGRRYTPAEDAPLSAYLAMLDANGSTHGVLIQPSFLGVDNSLLLTALDSQPDRLRGIVVIDPAAPRDALRAMHERGVVGVRLNLIGEPDPDLSSPLWRTHLTDLAALGWQVEVQAEARRLAKLIPPLVEAGVKVVVDHFGRPDPKLGVEDPGFLYLLSVGAGRRVWVKLSAPYRLGAGTAGEVVAAKAAPMLLHAFGPERLVWGSDWPHTEFEAVADTGKMRQVLDGWVPDPIARGQVLSATPAALFQFDRRQKSRIGAARRQDLKEVGS